MTSHLPIPLTSLFIHRRGAAATVRLLRVGHLRQRSSNGTEVGIKARVATAGSGSSPSSGRSSAPSITPRRRDQPLPRIGLPMMHPKNHPAVYFHFPHRLRPALELSSSPSRPPRPDEGTGDEGNRKGAEEMEDEGGTTENTEARTSASVSTSDDDENSNETEGHRHDDGEDGDEVTYFPWRHASDPLPRLLLDRKHGSSVGILGESDTLAALRLPPLYIWFLHVYSANLVDTDLSYLGILFNRRRWEDGLAVNFASAYQMALGFLLSDTFRVPLEQVQADDGSIDFDHVVVVGGAKDEGDRHGDGKVEEDDDDDIRRSLNSMLEGKLSDLYRNSPAAAAVASDADDARRRRRVRIKLRSQIASTRLLNLHPIPVLTREAVEFNPSLRGGLRSIFLSGAIARSNGAGLVDLFRTVMEELDDLAVRCGNETGMDWTVVAQVEVRCRETFQVIALGDEGEDDGGGDGGVVGATVRLLQGRRPRRRRRDVGDGEGEGDGEEYDDDDDDDDDDALMATHLVRFELVVTDDYGETGGREGRRVGSWRITDWDDLLGGNIWF